MNNNKFPWTEKMEINIQEMAEKCGNEIRAIQGINLDRLIDQRIKTKIAEIFYPLKLRVDALEYDKTCLVASLKTQYANAPVTENIEEMAGQCADKIYFRELGNYVPTQEIKLMILETFAPLQEKRKKTAPNEPE